MASITLSPSQARASVNKMLKASDRVAYMTSRFAPQPLQPHYRALRALDMELLSLKSLPDPETGVKRMAQWKEVVHDIFAESRGSTTASPPPAHPIAISLAEAVLDPNIRANRVGGLKESRVLKLIETREAQLDPMPPATMEEIEEEGVNTYGQLYRLWLDVAGVRSYPDEPDRDGPVERLMTQLAQAAGLTYSLAQTPPSAVGMPITPHKALAFARGTDLGPEEVAPASDRRGLPLRVLLPVDMITRGGLNPDQVMIYFNPSVHSKTAWHNPRASQDFALGIYMEEIVYGVVYRSWARLNDARASWKALKKGAAAPGSQVHAGLAATYGPLADEAKAALARDQEEAAQIKPATLSTADLKTLCPPLSEGAFFANYLTGVQGRSYCQLREPLLEKYRLGKTMSLKARMAWMRWTGQF